MYEVDCDKLIRLMPEFHKSILNKVEEKLNAGKIAEAYQHLCDYKALKQTFIRNNLYSYKYEQKSKDLEEVIMNAPDSDEIFNQKVIQKWKTNKKSED